MFSYAAAIAEWLRRADRHRNAVLAALLATACAEVALGISSEPHVLPMLAVWLALGIGVGRVMSRVHDLERRRRWRAVILTADILGVALVQYAAGGTAWFGALAYVFLLVVTAVAMSGRALAAFTVASALVYGVPLFGEAFGLLRPMPLAGVRMPPGTPAQAVVTWAMGALVLGGTSALLHTFMQLVRRSAEWHQLLVEQVPVMVGTLDETGRITAANPAAHAGLAAPPGALVGRHLSEFLPGDARDQTAAHLAAVMGGESRRFATRFARADGVERWADVLAHPVREDGRVTQAVYLLRDVTEERAAAAALEEREAYFRTLLQHSSDVTSVFDARGVFAYVSPSVERVFGRAPAELIGRTVAEVTHPEDLPALRRAVLATAADPSTPVTLRYRVPHADGSWRQVESVGRNLLGEPAVRGYVFNTRDVTERAELEAELTRQAYHDALTGLANRARFAERLGAALARARADADLARVAVLVLDLDGFKTVNDSLGHAAGDRLLVEVASRLLNATRGCDTVARLGGDEFAVLIEAVREDGDAVAVAERVVAALRPAFVVDGRQAFVGTSVGIARAASAAEGGGAAAVEEPDPVAALLRDADAAMYQAKARGKGRWALFEPAMHTAAVARLALEGDLRHALERAAEAGADEAGGGELRLVYQPVVELESRRIVGVEALVRWHHPKRGLVSPAEFIPFAEETGLIVPLGRLVLRMACRRAAAWQAELTPRGWGAAGGEPLAVAVNVSGQQLQDPAFVGEVAAAIAETGLAPGTLTLEITEYSVVERPELVRERLAELRALGVRVAIDDFGTGYSALSQLQQFPIDVLKVDRAFVDRVTRGGSHAAVTRALVALGDALRVRTVAEGIETEEQRAYLSALGCPLGQGYLFARPLEPEACGPRLLAEADARRTGEAVLPLG
jgi:diguanylate cyclase (GGDEF)-like protein/PAS domain S-box-containing protein